MTTTQRQMAFWLGGLALFFVMLWLLSSILLPFVAGFVIAYFLDPLVARLERLGIPRGLASLLVLALFLMILVLVVLLLLPIIQSQVLEFIARLPAILEEVRRDAEALTQLAQERLSPEDLAKLRDAIGGKLTDVFAWLGGLAKSVLTSGFALANLLSLIFVTPVVAFFLLRDWRRIVRRIDDWLPRDHADTIREQARLIDETLSGFLRGQLTVCMVLGLYYAIVLSVIGLDFGLVIGLLVGLLAFIPFVGVAVGFTLSTLMALTQFPDWTHVVMVLVAFAIGQTVEGNVLAPYLVGNRVNLHPVWIIFALLAFGSLFGFLGVLIAVPMAAVIGVLVRFGLSRYLASPLYDPARAGPCGDEE
jgi:predicted PurR-regulated permease PerM